jgi:hypothetical protein
MGIYATRFSNRVHNLVLNICDTNKVKQRGVNVVVLTKSKGTSAKCNDIYKKS